MTVAGEHTAETGDRGFLAHRATTLHEFMDDPDCDPAALRRSYLAFRLVNPIVSGWGDTYRRLIRPFLSADTERTLLDVGCGGGDIARALAEYARRDGLKLRITAIDPDSRAIEVARRTPDPAVELRQAHTADLVAEGATFDFVISNHVLHHLDADELQQLLEHSEQLAGVIAIHADIARSRWAFLAFGAATVPLAVGSFIRHDGLASIRRSYTTAELRRVARERWRVIPRSPSRQLLVWSPRGRTED